MARTPKFYRIDLKTDGTSVCPWCESHNNHSNGRYCDHVAKVTPSRVVFYFWGFRPIAEEG